MTQTVHYNDLTPGDKFRFAGSFSLPCTYSVNWRGLKDDAGDYYAHPVDTMMTRTNRIAPCASDRVIRLSNDGETVSYGDLQPGDEWHASSGHRGTYRVSVHGAKDPFGDYYSFLIGGGVENRIAPMGDVQVIRTRRAGEAVPSADNITLTLTPSEADTLSGVTAAIGGSPSDSRRGDMDRIAQRLTAQGVADGLRAEARQELSGSIQFSRRASAWAKARTTFGELEPGEQFLTNQDNHLEFVKLAATDRSGRNLYLRYRHRGQASVAQPELGVPGSFPVFRMNVLREHRAI